MRLFLGAFLSPDAQDFYASVMVDLVNRHPDCLRAIPKRSAHLTFAFCADTRGHETAGIGAAIRQVAARHHEVDVRFGQLRIVSAGPAPRLIAGEVESGGEALRGLTADLARTCQATFRDLEWKASREPHVTLVRFRKAAGRADRDAVDRTLQDVQADRAPLHDRIVAVEIIESRFTDAGPVYTTLETEPLS